MMEKINNELFNLSDTERLLICNKYLNLINDNAEGVYYDFNYYDYFYTLFIKYTKKKNGKVYKKRLEYNLDQINTLLNNRLLEIRSNKFKKILKK